MSFLPKVCLNVIIIRNRKNEKHALENKIFNLVEKILCLRVMLSGEKILHVGLETVKKNDFVSELKYQLLTDLYC